MYKLMFLLVVIIAVGSGLVLGTLNSDPVQLDLLWVQLFWPLGLITVIALSIGILLGSGATWVFQVMPAKLALRRERQSVTTKSSTQESTELVKSDDA